MKLAPRRWLISQRADFWFASSGASIGLLAALGWILVHGDREFDWADLVLSELHLGATYDAILRRRLWRRLPGDVVVVPLIILAATFALINANHWLTVTTITMYAAIWHRGRQNLGIARFYQRFGNGPVSPLHRWLFGSAIYVPMLAAAFLYNHLAADYEGDPYFAIDTGAKIAWGIGLMAVAAVAAYMAWIWWYNRRRRNQELQELHPGETWMVLAHAVAFGSAYVFGSTHTSFLFVLTVQHEVQYLYFTYAVARWPTRGNQRENIGQAKPVSGLRFAASFAVWPVIGLAGSVSSTFYQSEWLTAFGVGGLFCHYWLDGRIWTRRSMAAAN